MRKDIDIIIYGATGFTGKLCVEYLASEERPTKWAIAGRNEEKLKKIKDRFNLPSDIGLMIVDSNDQESIDAMVNLSLIHI